MENPKEPKAFLDLLSKVTPGKDYVFLLDTDHTSVEIRDLVSRPDVMRALKDAGVRTFLQEGPEMLNSLSQSVEQRVAIGEAAQIRTEMDAAISVTGGDYQRLDLEKSKRHALSIVEIPIQAYEHGMKHGYPDPGYPPEMIEKKPGGSNAEAERFVELAGYTSEAKCVPIVAAASMASRKAATATNSGLPDAVQSPPPAGDAKPTSEFLRDRLAEATEKRLADSIARYASGQPAAVMYGMGHTMKEKDLNEFLPKNTTIAIYPDERSRVTVGAQNFTQAPDYMYVISTDRVADLANGSVGKDNFFGRIGNGTTGTVPVLTEAEHKACVEALPDQWKAKAPVFENRADGELGGLPVASVPSWKHSEPRQQR